MPDFSSFTPEQITSYTNAFVKILITLVILAWVIIYRSAIADLFRTLTKLTLKAIGFEASVEFNGRQVKEEAPSVEVESREEQVEPEEAEEEKVPVMDEEVPGTLVGWEREMLFCALMNEPTKMQEAFDAGLKLAKDDADKYKFEIAYSDYRVRFLKDDSHIAKIQVFIDAQKYEPTVVERAFSVLGNIRYMLKDYPRAKEYYELALEVGTDETRKCFYERQIARNRYEMGQKKEAINDYGSLLEKYTEPDQQVTIYKELAELYEEAGDEELRALATEKALEMGDDDHRTYFNAAYSYSHSDFDKLSLLHYQSALRLGSGEGSLNNMGVQYEQLGLPIKSIQYYHKAFSDDNTLAAANMAYRLIGAGFIDEAKKILEDAQSKKSDNIEVHENVYSALASIKSAQEKESKKEVAILKEATEQQRYLRAYAKHYFTKTQRPTVDVNYFPAKDAEIEVEIINGKIKGFWKEKVRKLQDEGYWTYEHKLEGELYNRAAKITLYKESIYGSEFEKENEGYLYIGDNGELCLLLENKYSKGNYESAQIVKRKS